MTASHYSSSIFNKQFSPGKDKKSRNNRPLFWLLLFCVAFVGSLVFASLGYDDVVTSDPDKNPTLTPERQEEIERRQKKNSEGAEQYVLRAIVPGFRECYLCPEGKVWLEVNEIAKIGITTDGQNRYSTEFYEKHEVYYVLEYRGDLTTAKNRELARLGGYPLLPENQKRKKKLIYPPLNSKLD
ncbi:MAG: hypothetical protein DWQ02_21170 [Bacteroidetes bacterium]|nr:MAG: hypothetical protein DWQ02_21170 [Bacteroidota bacterium]